MRLAAVRRGHSMDKRDRDSVGLITQKAGEFRGYAASYRAQAADTRTEKALRATIAKQFPQLHNREASGRNSHQQAQQAEQRQHAPAAVQDQPQQSRGQKR